MFLFPPCCSSMPNTTLQVGWFNWVPELLNVDKKNSPDVIRCVAALLMFGQGDGWRR